MTDYYWIGTTNDSWSTGSNWDKNSVPGTGSAYSDTVLIDFTQEENESVVISSSESYKVFALYTGSSARLDCSGQLATLRSTADHPESVGTVDDIPFFGLDNGGLLLAEASGPFNQGTLLIQCNVANTLTTVNGTSRGTIEALGAGDVVQLDNATVSGVIVETVGGGLIQVGDGTSASATATLDDVTFTGHLEVGRGNTLGIGGGALEASGLIAVGGGFITMSGDVEIAGTATIQLTTSAGTPGEPISADYGCRGRAGEDECESI